MSNAPRQIVITGVSRGMGRALVERFIQAGHVVHGCCRSRAALDALSELYGAPHSFQQVDIADAAAVQTWGDQLQASGATPDLLINNAALMNELAPLWKISSEDFDQLIAVNVSGVANTVRSFVPLMIAAGRGVIVNLTSGWGHSSSPEVGPYCASKYAVEGLSGSLAQELPAGLACVTLSPGVVNTEMLRKCQPDLAPSCVDPGSWSQHAAPLLLSLGAQHNGQSLTVKAP